MSTFVEFNGRRYRLEPNSGYYRSSSRSLHRDVWQAANGPIPEGYDVHHRFEGDKATTDVSRLELLTKADHAALHAITNPWIGSPEHREHIATKMKRFERGYGQTEWGAEVLRRRIEKRKKTGPKFEVSCHVCGKKYLVKLRRQKHTCSKACKYIAAKRSRSFWDERTCHVCGVKFIVPKARRPQACSVSCGRWGRPHAAGSI